MELLERDDALAALGSAYAAAAKGQGRVVLVSGEAGVGKTSLVNAFAAARRDARALFGGCEALFSPRPLGPLYDIAKDLGSAVSSLLGQKGRRAELFTAVFDALHDSAAPTILVAEDLHWADAATLDLVKFLGRRVARTRTLLVLTWRDDEVDARHPLRLVLGDLPLASVTRVPLLPLSEQAVTKLASSASRALPDLYATTHGNPFFVTEMLRAGGLSPTLRDAVTSRLARQPADVQRLVELCAIVPARAERWLVARVLAPGVATLTAALASGLLHEDGEGFAFRHELARLAVADALPPARARELHARVLAELEGPNPPQMPRTRLVHHAGQAGDAAAVLRHAPAAAEQAALHGAHREAATLYRTALQYGGALPAARRIELLEGLSYQCYLTDQIADALAAREAVLDLARAQGDRVREGNTLRWLSRLSWFHGRNEPAERYANAAIEVLETLPQGEELAWAYSNRAQLDMLARRNPESIAWGERAIALADELGCEEVLIHALNNVGTVQYWDSPQAGVDKLERSLALAREHGFDEHVARAYANLTSSTVTMRDYARSERYFEDAAAYFGARDLDSWDLYVTAWRARFGLERGAWALAEECAQKVLAAGERASPIHRIPSLAVLAQLRARRGDPGVAPLLNEALALAQKTGEVQRLAPVAAARAEAAWLTADAGAIAREARPAFELACSRGDPRAQGELAYWLWKAGALREAPAAAEPGYALQIAGDWRGAAQAWQDAGAPYERARAFLEGDEAALREALSILEGLGAGALVTVCRDRLRALGAKGVPRGPRAATVANAAGLTARELQVLALMAEGLANAQIAQRLVRSEKTVDHHISAILAKLDARSRTEAVTAARRMGVLDA